MPFDPAVLTDDDGKVFLYYGFAPAGDKAIDVPDLSEEELNALPDDIRETMMTLMHMQMGENGMIAELEADMVTLKEVPHPLIPGEKHTAGTGFEGHGFFEASSIRKAGEKYYFVYSSHKSHELCYAVSDKPDREFQFGGTIISNGDIGMNGREKPVYTLGNNHGGIVQADGQWYIFYHRQTNGTEFSRQGCAERIKIDENGKIEQVEITSCGLNGGPLKGSGTYPAAIACHLTSPSTMEKIDYQSPVMQTQTRITENQKVSFITAITGGTVIGYKYFTSEHVEAVLLELRGKFKGQIKICGDEKGEEIFGRKEVDMCGACWKNISVQMNVPKADMYPVYFLFDGEGELDMKSFSFI